MKQTEFEAIQNNMIEKLGKDNFAKISDDMATLMTENNSMNKQIDDGKSEITKLKEDKTNLLETNGNLMQKISVGFEEPTAPQKQAEPEKVSIRDCFDEQGNFKI